MCIICMHVLHKYIYTNSYVTAQAEFKARIVAAKRCGVCVCAFIQENLQYIGLEVIFNIRKKKPLQTE